MPLVLLAVVTVLLPVLLCNVFLKNKTTKMPSTLCHRCSTK